MTNVDRNTSRAGIAAPDGSAHYYAVPLARRTRVVKAKPDGGGRTRPVGSAVLDGILAVPSITHETTTGISADGSTLVLVEPRRGEASPVTRLVVVDTKRMRQIAAVELDGYFGVYAVSPSGETLYLIHYLDPDWDARKNEVKALNVGTGRLRPTAIVDRPTASEPRLRGEVIARAMSPSGVLAYTLYDGGNVYSNEDQFINALDTASGTSWRIDVATDKRKHGLVVSPDGRTIEILGGTRGRTVASVDVGSWSVTEWVKGSPVGAAPPIAQPDDPPLPSWLADAGLTAAAIGIAFVLVAAAVDRRRRRLASRLPEDPLPDLDSEPRAESERQREHVS